MQVINKSRFDLTIIHPKTKQSIELIKLELTEIPDKFADVKAFQMYRKAGYIVVSGDKGDNQDDIKGEAKKLDSELDGATKQLLNKLEIPYNNEIKKDVLEKMINEKTAIWEGLKDEAEELGIKVHHLSKITTIKEMITTKNKEIEQL